MSTTPATDHPAEPAEPEAPEAPEAEHPLPPILTDEPRALTVQEVLPFVTAEGRPHLDLACAKYQLALKDQQLAELAAMVGLVPPPPPPGA